MANKRQKMETFKMLINGELVDGASTFAVINPSTSKSFADCPAADKAQTDAAIKAAKTAFLEWSIRSLEERKGYLSTAAKVIEEAKVSEVHEPRICAFSDRNFSRYSTTARMSSLNFW